MSTCENSGCTMDELSPMKAEEVEKQPQAADEDVALSKMKEMPAIDYFNKSFEAMWYQAEVLHKREVEKWEVAEKKWEENEKRYELKLSEVESNIKAGVFKFTKDILEMIQDYETQNETNALKILDLLTLLIDEKRSSQP